MELVFIKSNNLNEEPYTTSKVIAEYGGQQHKNVRELIQTHIKELKEFGKVSTFQTYKPQNHVAGGRPEKIYKLNEQQATFLITLMKNSKQVVEFKKNLVKQFYQMREELQQRRVERETELQSRKQLTAQIKEVLGNNQIEYIKYTQMIYKVLFNKTAQQLRDEYGVEKKKTPKDFMDADDVNKIKQTEYAVLTMLELGFTYSQIKENLIRKFNNKKAA